MPPTLLSRFDLIYLVLDKASEASDRKLARHLVSLYWKEPEEQTGVMDIQTLTSYVSCEFSLDYDAQEQGRFRVFREFIVKVAFLVKRLLRVRPNSRPNLTRGTTITRKT